ncbi:MAG: STAS domain-containing protein [Sedimentisphaerales bacterium]|nr:STAS domain-containing protein [Sedimentisphaerales bacterium]
MTENKIIQITTDDDITTVSFTVTSLTAEHGLENIERQIIEIIEDQKPQNLIIDFAGVKFFSSQMLGILINVKQKFPSHTGQIVISSINPMLYRVFKITNLDKIFTFYPNAKAAAESLKKSQAS